MIRQLPAVDILGTTFFVDVNKEELWEKGNSSNKIPFIVFDQEGDGYTFLYDLLTKRYAENKSDIKELGDRYQWVTLPALMELDPEGIALKYHIPLEILCPDKAKNSFDDEFDEEEDSYEDGIF